ncbi:MAG: hypothetical protein JXA44_10170 [Methanospirillaceae archaeon]|nr:hypothetical protein [Methanospirillaceae archaeon]
MGKGHLFYHTGMICLLLIILVSPACPADEVQTDSGSATAAVSSGGEAGSAGTSVSSSDSFSLTVSVSASDTGTSSGESGGVSLLLSDNSGDSSSSSGSESFSSLSEQLIPLFVQSGSSDLSGSPTDLPQTGSSSDDSTGSPESSFESISESSSFESISFDIDPDTPAGSDLPSDLSSDPESDTSGTWEEGQEMMLDSSFPSPESEDTESTSDDVSLFTGQDEQNDEDGTGTDASPVPEDADESGKDPVSEEPGEEETTDEEGSAPEEQVEGDEETDEDLSSEELTEEELPEEENEGQDATPGVSEGSVSSEDLAVLADTTMLTEEIPEMTGDSVAEQVASLCGGDNTWTGYWGDPVIDFFAYSNNPDPSQIYNSEAQNPLNLKTYTNLRYDSSYGFGWVDDGILNDKSDDYYQIGTESGTFLLGDDDDDDDDDENDWGNIFSIVSDIATKASYAIRIYATDITIKGNGKNVQSSGAGISLDTQDQQQLGDGIVIEEVNFAGTDGIVGTVRNWWYDEETETEHRGDITITNCNFENTGVALDIDASGKDSGIIGDPGEEQITASGTGGTITVAGADTTIKGDIILKANGGNGMDGQFYGSDDDLMYLPATDGGHGGTIEVDVKGVDSDTINIRADGGTGGIFSGSQDERMWGGTGWAGTEGDVSYVGFGLPNAGSGADINGGGVGTDGELGAGGDGGYGVNGYAASGSTYWSGSTLGADWAMGTDSDGNYIRASDGQPMDPDNYPEKPTEDDYIVYLFRAGQGGQGGEGGTGGDAGDGGAGGDGGTIKFAVDGDLTDATFSASGGAGGDGGIHFTADMGGETVHYCNSGGIGGTGGQGGTGGIGGIGGPVGDGGQGGAGGTGGNAGDGGDAGKVQIWASSISGTVNVKADGGAGGYGGDGGDGGAGGPIDYENGNGVSNYILTHEPPYPEGYNEIANGEEFVSGGEEGPQGNGGNAGTGGDGGDGGEVDMVLSGAITENGKLNAYALGGQGGTGGDGGLGSINGNGGDGGAGGTGGTVVTTVANGIPSSGSFTGISNGGNGGNGGTGDTANPLTGLDAGGKGGLGGDAGTVQFATEGDLAGTVDIDVYGGDGGAGGSNLCIGALMPGDAGKAGAGGNGGDGGTGQVWADDITEIVAITANGGRGGDGGSIDTAGTQKGIGGIGGTGGTGGYADLVLTGDIKADTEVHANGGNGGHGGGSRLTASSAGGTGGKGGRSRVFADDIGTRDTADPIVDTIDLSIEANGGVGGNGGKGIASSAGGSGDDGGTSVPDPGDARTDYNTINIVLSGDVLSDATIQGSANGGNGGNGGTGTGEPGNGDGAGGDGGDGGHIYMWADDIAQKADVKFWINGGEGGTGTPPGIGGNAPLNTIYVDTDTISGDVTGHAVGGAGGTDGRVYIGGTVTGGTVTADTNPLNGGSTAPPGVLPVPPVSPASPYVPAAPGPGPDPANPAAQTTPDVALTDNSSLSPADRIADYIAQLQALGFLINEEDLFSVIVSDITYMVVPATDPDGNDLWIVFSEEGALVSPVPGVDIGTDPLSPELLAQIMDLAAFVQQVSSIDPASFADLMQTIDESLTRMGETIIALLRDLGYPDAAAFISRVLENPSDYDLVAGWPCPAGYSEEERLVQFKEDYMKNYLVVMEALLAGGIDPDAPEPDTGAGQLTAWVATIIKYIQTSRAALEENYDTLLSHAEGTPWRYNEMQGFLDNEAAYGPVESDLGTLESLSGVSGGLSEAGAAVIEEADISRLSGIMQLISTGRFPDDAFTLATAAFDEGVVWYDLSDYLSERTSPGVDVV